MYLAIRKEFLVQKRLVEAGAERRQGLEARLAEDKRETLEVTDQYYCRELMNDHIK